MKHFSSKESNIYLSLDLEMAQPSGKIIQIGACVGNLYTGEILGEFNQLVKIDEVLTPFIIKLCGITDADLAADGVDLLTAYSNLLKFREHFETIERNPIVWGGDDMGYLKQQVSNEYEKIRSGTVFDYPFGRRHLDTKTVYQMYQLSRQAKKQSGLAKSINKLGVKFSGAKHNALADAKNTFLLMHELIRRFNVS